jgi:hypothetical protein
VCSQTIHNIVRKEYKIELSWRSFELDLKTITVGSIIVGRSTCLQNQDNNNLIQSYIDVSRSQWLCGQRHEKVFALSNTGIVDSNPTQGTDIFLRLFCVCIVLCVGNGLATDWSLVESYRLSVRLRNWSETKRFTDVLCSKWEQQRWMDGWMDIYIYIDR